MDSATQFALGAAIGVAVVGRRAPVWQSALWGGICGTLPDLDVLIDRGDPIRDMTMHRAGSHSLFYLALAAPAAGWLISRLRGDGLFRVWTLAAGLALITHPLLDLMTVYGTQLGLPFTDHPFYIGSVFVIDPAFTLPLLAGITVALVRGPPGLRWNRIGLALACTYLGWGVAAQAHVREVAKASLAGAGIDVRHLLVSPTPFNTVLWRVVAMTPGEDWYEGYRSLLDDPEPMAFTRRRTDQAMRDRHAGDWYLERIAWFSHGFFDVAESPSGLRIRDLRMGMGDQYTFTFVVRPAPVGTATSGSVTNNPTNSPADSATSHPTNEATGGAATDSAAAGGAQTPVIQLPYRVDPGTALPWLWRRMQGHRLALPAEPIPAIPDGRTAIR